MNKLNSVLTWILKKLWSVKFYILFILMALTITKMFQENYQFQSPVISKKAETFTQVTNDRATCLTELDQVRAEKQAAITAGNPDLFN